MAEPCCAFTRPNGEPCHARPLPGSDFCLFHDPERQQTLAEGRSKGGAAPRRRIRRFPAVLDHLHVAELLSELFIEALNHPEALDARRLQALTTLARALLKAVGVPAKTALVHQDRSEPAAAGPHLLRIYPPEVPELEPLPQSDPALEANPEHLNTQDPPFTATPPECLSAPTPEQGVDRSWTGTPGRNRTSDQVSAPPAARRSAPADRKFRRQPDSIDRPATCGVVPSIDLVFALSPGHCSSREQNTEQEMYRFRTGLSPAQKISPAAQERRSPTAGCHLRGESTLVCCAKGEASPAPRGPAGARPGLEGAP